MDGPLVGDDGKWDALDATEDRVTDETLNLVAELVRLEECVSLLTGHEASRLCGTAEEIVAANVGLLFEIGSKESVDHFSLGGFPTTEPSLEGESVRICRLARLSGHVEINPDAFTAFLEGGTNLFELFVAKLCEIARDATHWPFGWERWIELEGTVLDGKVNVWMRLTDAFERLLDFLVRNVAPRAIEIGDDNNRNSRDLVSC